jgi:hypothetical protein
MKEAIAALNKIRKQGVIDGYAIGGAIGASFYIEAVNTSDVDAFVLLVPPEGSLLISLTPIYDALIRLGGEVVGEHIKIGGWPIQILAVEPGLTSDALNQALEVTYAGELTYVFTAEHICAIALKTNRTKDYLRIAMFMEQKAVDMPTFNEIIRHYGLQQNVKKIQDWPENIGLIQAGQWIKLFGNNSSEPPEESQNNDFEVVYLANDGIVLDDGYDFEIVPIQTELNLQVGQKVKYSAGGILEVVPDRCQKPL